jgi:hypothetical protein
MTVFQTVVLSVLSTTVLLTILHLDIVISFSVNVSCYSA